MMMFSRGREELQERGEDFVFMEEEEEERAERGTRDETAVCDGG